MPIVHIGIGSNLGDRQTNCTEAINRLKRQGLTILKQSSMIETEPWGVTEQPLFINMAVEAETKLTPEELLEFLKATETDMGRQESLRWGPRVIDLDILFYDDRVIESSDLVIPHPHLHERDFVLKPLSEICPDKVHPVLKKQIQELCR